MTKLDLIKKVSENTGLSREMATRVVETFLSAIKESLQRGEKVNLTGIGVLSVRRLTSREVINPRTGRPIWIPPRRGIRFKASKRIKTAINFHHSTNKYNIIKSRISGGTSSTP